MPCDNWSTFHSVQLKDGYQPFRPLAGTKKEMAHPLPSRHTAVTFPRKTLEDIGLSVPVGLFLNNSGAGRNAEGD